MQVLSPCNTNVENSEHNAELFLLESSCMNVIVDEHGTILNENCLEDHFNEIVVKQSKTNEDQLISVETSSKPLKDVTNIVEIDQDETKANYNSTIEMQMPEIFGKSVFWPKKDLYKNKKGKTSIKNSIRSYFRTGNKIFN